MTCRRIVVGQLLPKLLPVGVVVAVLAQTGFCGAGRKQSSLGRSQTIPEPKIPSSEALNPEIRSPQSADDCAEESKQSQSNEIKAIVRERFERGKKWAVIVGINQYRDTRITDLRFCVNDSQLVSQTLQQKCGYDEKNILLINDKQRIDMQPSKYVLRRAIERWLRGAKQGDTVVVYYSGHGYEQNGKGYLVPNDCDVSDVAGTRVPLKELSDILDKCPAKQKLLVLDCCHAGAVRGDTFGPSSHELGKVFKDALGLITLASCAAKEKSHEWNEKGQGLFTFFLAEGLQGAADFDGDGIVNSDEIYKYLDEQVPPVATKKLGGQQTPRRNIPPSVKGVFALAKVERRNVKPPGQSPHNPAQEVAPTQSKNEAIRFSYGAKLPAPWQNKRIDNAVHHVQRSGVQISGRFYVDLRIGMNKSPSKKGICDVVLVGKNGTADMALRFAMADAFSNGANWLITSPKDSVREPIADGLHSIRLERDGAIARLVCDRTLRSGTGQANVVLSKFPLPENAEYGAFEIGINDAGVLVDRISLNCCSFNFSPTIVKVQGGRNAQRTGFIVSFDGTDIDRVGPTTRLDQRGRKVRV